MPAIMPIAWLILASSPVHSPPTSCACSPHAISASTSDGAWCRYERMIRSFSSITATSDSSSRMMDMVLLPSLLALAIVIHRALEVPTRVLRLLPEAEVDGFAAVVEHADVGVAAIERDDLVDPRTTRDVVALAKHGHGLAFLPQRHEHRTDARPAGLERVIRQILELAALLDERAKRLVLAVLSELHARAHDRHQHAILAEQIERAIHVVELQGKRRVHHDRVEPPKSAGRGLEGRAHHLIGGILHLERARELALDLHRNHRRARLRDLA